MSDPQTDKNLEVLPVTPPSTDLGINKIKEDIEILKKDAQALDVKRTDFEKNKKILVKEESDKLKKEIDAEAIRIEAKKKELLTLIKQTTGELEVLKGSIEISTQKSQLEQLEKEINEIQGQKKNVFEKARERGKENPKKAILATAGVGLLIRGISKLFRRRKTESKEGDGNKEKKRSKVRKWILGIGVGIAAMFGISRLIDKFKGETLEPKETQTDDFDKLSDVEKAKYNTFGGKVNDMYSKIYQKEIDDGILNDADLGKGYNSTDATKYAGVVPFAMDKTYSDVKSMLSEKTVNRHIWKKNATEYKNIIVGFGKDWLAKLLGPSLMKLQSFNVLGYKPGEDISEKILKRLDTNTEEACRELDFFFRQFVMTLAYLEEKKIQLRRKLVEKKINELGYGDEKKKLAGLEQEEQDDLIEEALDDEKWMEINVNGIIKAEFETQKISSIEATLSKYQIYDGTISAELQEEITSLDEKRNDLLDYDEESKTDILDRAETDIADGTLEKDNQDKLAECADDILNDAQDDNGEGFMQTYFEPFAIACNMDAVAREKFLQESGGKELLDNFALGMAKYKEKITAGTMTKEDMSNFKAIVNKYLIFKKEVIVAVHTLQNLHSDDPAVLSTAFNTILETIKGFYECFTEKMPFLKRATHFCWGMIVIGGILYMIPGVFLGNRLARVAGKNMVKVGALVPYLGFRAAMAGIKYAGGRMIFSGRYWQSKVLDAKDPLSMFEHAFMNGEITPERAVKITRSLREKGKISTRIDTVEELLEYFKVPQDKIPLVTKYMKEKNIRKLIITKTAKTNMGTSDRRKYNVMERKSKWIYKFSLDETDGAGNITKLGNLSKLKYIDAAIDESKKSGVAIKSILTQIDVKQFDKFYTMVHSGTLVGDIDDLFLKMGSKLDVKKFGKLLGDNLDQFTDAADVKKFFDTLESSNVDAKNFVIMIRKWKDVKARLARGEKLTDILSQLSKNFARVAPEIKILDDLSAQKIANFIYEKRRVNLDDLLSEFEPNGKYSKYSEFKPKYDAARNDVSKLQDLDMEFSKRLLRDGHKVEDILEFTADQKAIAKLIGGDIDELKKFIKTDLPKQGGTQGSVLEIYYKNQLKRLEEFKYKIPGFAGQEMESFKNLRKLKFTSTHIVELFELGDSNAEVKRVLSAGGDDIEELLTVLNREKTSIERAGKQVSKGLIEGLEGIKKIRSTARAGDEIFNTIKSIFKLVAKVT